MAATAALIPTDGLGGLDPVTPGAGNTSLGGLTLTKRPALAAHRAGIDRLYIVLPDEVVLAWSGGNNGCDGPVAEWSGRDVGGAGARSQRHAVPGAVATRRGGR